MTGAVTRYYDAILDVESLKAADLIGYFVYYLTFEEGETVATPSAIERCFRECDLPVPANVSARLAEGLKGSSPRYVKVPGGYRLERRYRDEIAQKAGQNLNVVQKGGELRKLESQLHLPYEKGFLKELIDCYEVGANRAAIIMCWILTIDHLCEFVFKHHLDTFNAALAKNPERKVNKIQNRDDFGDIGEKKLVELLRSAGIISNDVRKILDEKLGTRNSCAHPSGVAIKPSKVLDFIDDLIANVVIKYAI